MGKFYLETTKEDEDGKKVIYELHATTSIGVSIESQVTEYPTEEGSIVADNIVVQSKEVDLQGILTDVSQSNSESIQSLLRLLVPSSDEVVNKILAVEVYIDGLIERIKNKETFTVWFSEALEEVPDCVITSFKKLKTNEYGGEAWQISISLKQIRFADRAKKVKEPTAEWAGLLKAEQEAAAAAKAKEVEVLKNKLKKKELGLTQTIFDTNHVALQ